MKASVGYAVRLCLRKQKEKRGDDMEDGEITEEREKRMGRNGEH